MFFKWNKAIINNEEVLYIFIESNVEFSKESNNNEITKYLNKKIENFFKNNNVDYKNKKVYLVSNNLIIGKIDFSKPKENNIEKYIDFNKVFNNDKDIEVIDVINDNDKVKIPSDKYIKNKLLSEISSDLEKEALKAIIVILRTNLLANSDIKETALVEIINDEAIENKIDIALKETKNDYLKINNQINQLESITELEKINVMAKVGYNFKQILYHYYPKSKIDSL